MRIVQILLLLTGLHYVFLIVLLLLPDNAFQSFYLQTGSLLDFCKIHIEKETRDEKLYNGYSGMYLSPQVIVFEIEKYLTMLLFTLQTLEWFVM